jgi:hypothetical protein
MVIEWMEREHEEIYAAVERDARAQQALRRCGLYKGVGPFVFEKELRKF